MLHLDHGPDLRDLQELHRRRLYLCDDRRILKPFAENIEITKRVVEYAHDHAWWWRPSLVRWPALRMR